MVSIKSPDASPSFTPTADNGKISNLQLSYGEDLAINSKKRSATTFDSGDGFNKAHFFAAYLSNALSEQQRGNYEPIDGLIRQISIPPSKEDAIPEEKLRQWLDTMSNMVSQLNQTHRKLVQAVIHIAWIGRGEAFVKAYLRFLGYLISAQPAYLSSVTSSLVNYWTGKVTSTVAISTKLSSQEMQDRTHVALEYLLSLVPTAPSNLFPIFVKAFPHKSQRLDEQTTYLMNLLRMIGYAPALRNRILGVVIDRILQIDVEIQVELEELDEEEEEGALFGMDDTKSKNADGDDMDSDSDIDEDDMSDDDQGSPVVVVNIREMVVKLDNLLNLVFEYLSSSMHDAEARGESTSELFFAMLDIFERIILCTFRSRYTQFLLFWLASLSSAHCDAFLGMLVSRIFDTSRPQVSRVASVFYCASFVARAKFLPAAVVKNVVGLLCNWMEDYVNRTEMQRSVQPDVARHELFYSVTQAVFYIFCFRWKDLEDNGPDGVTGSYDSAGLGSYDSNGMIFGSMDSANGHGHMPDGSGARKWIPALMGLRRSVMSSLNPLRCCHPVVVQQFATVSHALDFIYCASIMEANRRTLQADRSPPRMTTSAPTTPAAVVGGGPQLQRRPALPPLRTHSASASTPSTPTRGLPTSTASPSTPTGSISSNHQVELDAFFPFDPYRLPISKRFVEEAYLEWEGLPGQNESDSDDSQDEDDDADVMYSLQAKSRDIIGAMSVPDSDNDPQALGLDQMSISPAPTAVDPRMVSARLLGM